MRRAILLALSVLSAGCAGPDMPPGCKDAVVLEAVRDGAAAKLTLRAPSTPAKSDDIELSAVEETGRDEKSGRYECKGEVRVKGQPAVFEPITYVSEFTPSRKMFVVTLADTIK